MTTNTDGTNRFPTIPAGAIAVITHTDPPLDLTQPTPEPCTCRATRQRLGGSWGWATLDGAWFGDNTLNVTDARPLAVIDPDSPADRSNLQAAFDSTGNELTDHDIQTALAAYVTPAAPPEPTDGGPLADAGGAFWWRRNAPGSLWTCLDQPSREPLEWAALWDAYGPIALPGGAA